MELKFPAGTDDLLDRRFRNLGVRLCLVLLGTDGDWFGNASVSGFATEIVSIPPVGGRAFLTAFLAGLVAEPCTPNDLDRGALLGIFTRGECLFRGATELGTLLTP